MSHTFVAHPGGGAGGDVGTAIPFVHDDGGRAAAGLRGCGGDCCCRALAIASGLPYREVAELIAEFAQRERPRKGMRSAPQRGVRTPTIHRVVGHLGGTWTPTMAIGSGCTVHVHASELPRRGRLVLNLSRHVAAVIDGVLRDTHDCSRGGTRCVYGWWTLPGARRPHFQPQPPRPIPLAGGVASPRKPQAGPWPGRA